MKEYLKPVARKIKTEKYKSSWAPLYKNTSDSILVCSNHFHSILTHDLVITDTSLLLTHEKFDFTKYKVCVEKLIQVSCNMKYFESEWVRRPKWHDMTLTLMQGNLIHKLESNTLKHLRARDSLTRITKVVGEM